MRVRRSVSAFYFVVLAVSFLLTAVSRPVLAASDESQPATQQQSATSLVIAPNPATVGQTITFTAKVTGAIGLSGVPTGTLIFQDQTDSTQLASVTLDPTGTATFSTASLAVGMYTIVAMYGGDSNFLPSNSQPVILNIVPVGTQLPSTTFLRINPDPAMLGQTVTFTAHVTGGTGIIGNATGTVTFFNGSTVLGMGTLDATSTATFTDSSLPLGTYSITAMYGGDAMLLPSTSVAVSLQVVPVGTLTPTTTTLSSSAPSTDFGNNVTFTAIVMGGLGNAPTGSVTFLDGTTSLGMGTLSDGTATFSTSSLSVGTHTITAQYSGDTNFAGSTSQPLTETITPSSTLTFVLNVDPSTITVSQGNSGTATVTLTPSGGFNQQVTFLCSGLPIYALCSFSPPSITPDGSNTPVNVVMTVSTNVKTALLRRPMLHRGGPLLADMVAAFSVGMLGLMQIKVRSRKRDGRAAGLRGATWFLLALCVLGTICIVACGGSSGGRVLTPKGMSTVTIAGSTSTGAQTTSFTLTVQ